MEFSDFANPNTIASAIGAFLGAQVFAWRAIRPLRELVAGVANRLGAIESRCEKRHAPLFQPAATAAHAEEK